ncbi:MAG: hypothetical protein JNL28_14520 [Planctomycetes bacterium]|nr:hypothetical protein [Planctomycetota bacterium]
MSDVDPNKLAQAERTLCWSTRSCALGLVIAVAAFIMALADFGGRDETLLSAIGLMTSFIAVFFGLAGLFGMALARETPGLRPSPKWAVPCGVGSILGSFAVGLFGMLT